MKTRPSLGQTLWRNIRRQFLAGALVLIPLALALYVLYWLFRFVDNILQPVIGLFFGHHVTGLGLLATLVLIYIVGLLTNNYVGRKTVQLGEWLIKRVPLVSDLYSSSKQALEILSGAKESRFREVVLVEYPRLGIYTIAFVTNEIAYENGQKAYVLLIPHAPNPITGFLQIFPEDQVIHTTLTVREALTMTVSGGLASPPVINRRTSIEAAEIFNPEAPEPSPQSCSSVEQQIIDIVSRIYNAIGWPGVVLLMAIESACVPLPSEVIMPFAGWFLIADRGLGWEFILLAGLCGAIGNVIGSAGAYWVGARGGRPFLVRYGKYVLLTKNDLDSAHRWFTRYGEATAFFSRLLPVVRTFISLPAGIARTNFGRFMAYSFAGSFIWSTVLAGLGYALGSNWEEVRNVIRPFDWPIVILIVAAIGFYIWRKWPRGRF